jgi:hypothetical protein
MTVRHRLRLSIATCAFAGATACASPGLPTAANQSTLGSQSAAAANGHQQAAVSRAVIAADDTLFVGDGGANVVRIYDFSVKDRPIGQISIDPAGVCSDPAGNVWMAGNNGSGFAWYEYRHDGSGPIATLPVVSSPVSCAVDPTTGDLAVANYGATVNIYKHAHGSPKTYSDPNVSDFYYCSYDDQSNLFVQGIKFEGQDVAVADELASGSSSLQPISFGTSDSIPGGLAWDGKHLAVAFADSSAVYRFKTGSHGVTLVDEHDFALYNHGFFGIAIHKHRLVTIGGPLDDSGTNIVAKFQYPIGAKELNEQPTGLQRGIAISLGTASKK